jgi:outer membrane receptor protein involved in Fe transport
MASVLASFFAVFTLPAISAESDDDDRLVEEVIVTATHRETALMDTPMGIGAVTGDMIKELGAQEMGEIFRMISGLNMGGEGAAQTRYTVRGVTSQQTNSVRDTAGSMVAVYLDGASLTSALGPARQITGNLFDIDRVEALKGPQGTLFGEGAQGGAVRYIYNEPVVNEWDASIKFGTGNMRYSDDTSTDWNAMVNIPLIEDRLAARVMLFDSDKAGYIDRLEDCTPVTGDNGYPTARPVCTGLAKDVNSTEHSGGRIAIKYFGDTWSAELAHYVTSQEGDGTAYVSAGSRGDTYLIDTYDPYISEVRAFNGVQGDGWDDFDVTRFTFDMEFGFADLTFIATDTNRDSLTFRELADPLVRGIDWLTANGANSTGRCLLVVEDPDVNCPVPLDAMNMDSYGWDGWTDVDRETYEVRLVSNQDNRLRWTAGAYYKNSLDWSWSGVLYSMEPGREIYNELYFFDSTETSHQTEFTEESFFADVSYDLTDTLELTVGARVASLEQDFLIGVNGSKIASDSRALGNWRTPEAFSIYESYVPERLGVSDDSVTSPRVVLTWRPTNGNLMAYVSYAEGYRPGGANRGVLLDAQRLERDADAGEQTGLLTPAEIAERRNNAAALREVVFFDGDTVKNYEIGTKFETLEGRMDVQASLYWVDWEDVIQRSERPLPNGNIVGFNANEGAAEIYGADLDINVALTDSLSASLIAAFVDTELTDALQNEGNELIFSSPFSITLAADYDMVLSDDLALTFHVDYSNYDERWFNTDNTVALPDYDILNARVTLRDASDRWSIVLWGKNLTDEQIVRDRYSDLTTGSENPWLGDLRGSYQYLDPPRSIGFDFTWNLGS